MHQPPAVVWKIARTRFQGGQLLVLGALVPWVHAAWWVQSGTSVTAQLGAAAAAVAALLYAWLDWRRAPVGHILWDGRVWSWSGPTGLAQAAVPVVTMDFQFLMLLRLDLRDRGRCWCWVGRAQDAASWQPLRRALFAGVAAGAGGEPAPANAPFTPVA